LDDTRLEVLGGTALVEIDELLKGNHITVQVGDVQTALLKRGLYYFDAEVGRLRVFDGKAQATGAGVPVELTKGRTVLFDPLLKAEKFKTKDAKDSLYAWSEGRAERLALANISAARTLSRSSMRTSSSFWAWDPYLGMYTFMPRSGSIGSPFGMYWYSPRTVWIVFQPPTYVSNGGGYSGPSNNSWSGLGGGSSASGPAAASDGGMVRSTPAAAPAASAAPAAPAAAPSSGSRGR
jgi:hypothetical protein